MKALFIIIIYLCSINNAMASDLFSDLAYGNDDRIDVYKNSNPFYKKITNATAGMINKNRLVKNEDGTFKIKFLKTLGKQFRLNKKERFYNQPLAPICSGFLIDDDVLVTAGHCYLSLSMMYYNDPGTVCADFRWVFGYIMENDHKINTKKIKEKDVYKCERVIKASEGELDFAVINLSSAFYFSIRGPLREYCV